MNKDTFQQVLVELERITRDYDERKLKHMQYVERYENVFMNYGISKEEYYKELTNQVNENFVKPIVKPIIKKIPVKKKLDIPF